MLIPNELARDVELSHTARSVVLLLLSHADGYEVSAKSIAAEMGRDRAAISKALDELDARRWLAIRHLPGNRREYLLHVSRRFTEAEHAELTHQPTLAGKTRKGLPENPASTLPENPATKKTKENTNLEDQHVRYVSNADARDTFTSFADMSDEWLKRFGEECA
ncbi:MarR family transcriptional regulator [Mycolicibacterium pallens]